MFLVKIELEYLPSLPPVPLSYPASSPSQLPSQADSHFFFDYFTYSDLI